MYEIILPYAKCKKLLNGFSFQPEISCQIKRQQISECGVWVQNDSSYIIRKKPRAYTRKSALVFGDKLPKTAWWQKETAMD
ncbi:MAG: hypothetical protein JW750_11565 [Anaerolineaceae bacterium]|nr:hypothetical protein [Anaerolineaceae bacterium]